MNPTGAHGFLTPGPETLPIAFVHSADETKRKSLEEV
jgi:hypothetical protein